MEQSYRIEKLGNQLSLFISEEHRFGTDAFLLSHYAAPKRKDRVVDLGTGCGIIPFLLYQKFSPALIYGVDIQEQAIAQFTQSVETNQLTERLIPLLGDLRALRGTLPFDHFDLVTCNPPYFAADSGAVSDHPAHRIARHEIMCTIDDVCSAAFSLLKTGGKLCLCQRPERLTDTITAMRKNRIEPKRMRFVAKNDQTNPWLFLIEGKKDSKPYLVVEPTLQVVDGGEYTEEMSQIYGF